MLDPGSCWEWLFDDVAATARRSVRQSRASILRQAQQRLALDGDDLVARHVLAVAELQAGQAEQCLERLQAAGWALQTDAVTNRVAAYACLALAQPRTAKTFFDRSIRLMPHAPDAWAWLGRIHESRGEIEQALAYYQRGAHFDDARFESTLALARLLAQVTNVYPAIVTLREALRRDRRSPLLHLDLARYLRRLATKTGRRGNWRRRDRLLREAARSLSIVVATAPTPSRWMTLAAIERDLDRFDAAQAAYAKAVQLSDRDPRALTKLATTYLDAGNLDVATGLLRQVLGIHPEYAPAHFYLSRVGSPGDAREAQRTIIELQRQLAAGVDAPIAEPLGNRRGSRPTRGERAHVQRQVALRFALARTLDDAGRYDEAWEHYDTANRFKAGHSDGGLHREGAARLQRLTTRRIECFSAEFFLARQDAGAASRVPTFIIGMPRSGTTLVEQILSSHPEIQGAGELKYVEQLRQQLGFDLRRSQGRSYKKDDIDVLQEVAASTWKSTAATYLQRLREAGGDSARVIDKMPTNFLHLGFIAVMFPHATIIHCRRDPLDVLVSSYCQNLTAPFCDLQALSEYYREYRRLMQHWERVLPLTIHHVDYESLVSQPEDNMRRLVESCGLAWNPACLAFHQNRRAVRTPSKYQVRQPMYRSSVGKWRRFERHLQHVQDRIHEIESEFGATAPQI